MPHRASTASSVDLETSEWDRFVSEHGGALAQRSLWPRTKGESFNSTVAVVRERGEIVAGALLQIRRIAPGIRVGLVSGGPVCATDDTAARDEVVDRLLQAARNERLLMLAVSPAVDDRGVPAALRRRGFAPSALSIAPSATVLVDLNGPADELFARLSKSRRRAVRRAEGLGVVVRDAGRDDLETFARLHAASASAGSFTAQSPGSIRRLWELLEPEGLVHMSIAEHDGEPVAADLLVADGDRLVDKLTGWSGTPEARAVRPNALLNWRLMLRAKELGFTHFDFGGLRREIAEALLDGSATAGDFTESPDYLKLTFGGSPTLLPPTFVHSFVPGGRYLIDRVGRRAGAPGVLNRSLNRLRS